MEEFERKNEKERFRKFNEVIEQRVADIGAGRGTTMRSAQAVIRRLFTSSEGDATKVTDDDIRDVFDVVDQ